MVLRSASTLKTHVTLFTRPPLPPGSSVHSQVQKRTDSEGVELPSVSNLSEWIIHKAECRLVDAIAAQPRNFRLSIGILIRRPGPVDFVSWLKPSIEKWFYVNAGSSGGDSLPGVRLNA